MTSQRLPGKALLDIYGRCLLGRVIDRSKYIEGVDKLIIATSTDVEDDSIVKFAETEGIDVFRGSLDDVVGRALAACECFKLTQFARICGDRPFFDPELVSNLIQIHRSPLLQASFHSNLYLLSTKWSDNYSYLDLSVGT